MHKFSHPDPSQDAGPTIWLELAIDWLALRLR
jgi:hypothetical protein